MDLCECVIEYHRDDGEGEDFQEVTQFSYTRRYISLSVESDRDWGVLR
jgi:hypothetical protein